MTAFFMHRVGLIADFKMTMESVADQELILHRIKTMQ
jgi:hypothetical protein